MIFAFLSVMAKFYTIFHKNNSQSHMGGLLPK